jgi:hypothetical protein
MTDDPPEITPAEFEANDGLITERQAIAELQVRSHQLPDPVARLATGAKPKVYEREAVRRQAVKLSNPDVYEYVSVHPETGELLTDYPQQYARHVYGCYVMDQTSVNATYRREKLTPEVRAIYYPCKHCH